MSVSGKKMATNTPLARLLTDRGISQTTLAFRLNLSVSQVNSYATGKTRPRAERRQEIARYLGVDPSSIWG